MKKLFTSITFLSIIGLGNLLAQTIVTTDPQLKTVVLEEYTGIHCGYCPDGHVIAGDIQASDPDRVILINIHAGTYAVPSGSEPDFRTAYGEDLATQAGVTGYPAGTVNRHIFTGNTATTLNRGAWTNAAADVLEEATSVNVGLESTWDSINGELTINVEVYYTNSSDESTNNLHVAILENGLEGPQTDYGPYNAANVLPNGNYVHGHVMRDMITGLNGESISTTSAGSLYATSYTYSVDPAWNISNCDIVAFVTETQEEILNGTEIAAEGGSDDGTTVLNIGELTEPILVSGNSYSIDATSFMAGSEDFIFTLTSDAPSNWSSSFDISGSNYATTATISLVNLTAQSVQVNVAAGATPAVATYILNMQSVSNPTAIHKVAEIIVIDGITDLIVNHDQG
ncbi:MAG: Omp28-related outer membrane protein, partial [Flavobacteriales bacterium]|nr:Omp28-related outer membrane protein [Flavobacteriales bacterium]